MSSSQPHRHAWLTLENCSDACYRLRLTELRNASPLMERTAINMRKSLFTSRDNHHPDALKRVDQNIKVNFLVIQMEQMAFISGDISPSSETRTRSWPRDNDDTTLQHTVTSSNLDIDTGTSQKNCHQVRCCISFKVYQKLAKAWSFEVEILKFSEKLDEKLIY